MSWATVNFASNTLWIVRTKISLNQYIWNKLAPNPVLLFFLLIFAIGNDECTIDAITSQEIVCKTPPENGGSMSVYPGNAGLKYELWRNTGEIDTTAGWQVINR